MVIGVVVWRVEEPAGKYFYTCEKDRECKGFGFCYQIHSFGMPAFVNVDAIARL